MRTKRTQADINAQSLRRYHAMTPAQREVLLAKARAYYAKVKDRVQERRRGRRDKIRETNRSYVAKNREKYYEYQAASRYKVKRAEIIAIRATSQVCEICGEPPTARKRLAIDHNHETGALRGMLCHTCNLGLGAFKDRVLLLHKAALYLAARECKGEVG